MAVKKQKKSVKKSVQAKSKNGKAKKRNFTLKPQIPLKAWKAGDKVQFVDDDGMRGGRVHTVDKLAAWEKQSAPQPAKKFVPLTNGFFYHISELSAVE